MSDRDLVRLHWPAELRLAFDALFGADDAMADVVLRASEPQLAAIKLAWWREQLQALDISPPPAEPRLQTAAAELLGRAVSGAELSRIEDGWLESLQPTPRRDVAASRGAVLFGLAARLLGGPEHDVGVAGEAWALADLARRTGSPAWLGPPPLLSPVPRRLRPVGALAVLAFRDHRRGFPLEAEGTPGRSWALIRHRVTGRL